MDTRLDPVLHALGDRLRDAGQFVRRQWHSYRSGVPGGGFHVTAPDFSPAHARERAGVALRDAWDRVNRHRLWSVGILAGVLGAAILIATLTHGGGGGGGSPDTARPIAATILPPKTDVRSDVHIDAGRPHLSTDEGMSQFFAAAPASQPATRPALASLVGTWEAHVVSIDGDGDPGGLRDTTNIPPFSFKIASNGDGYTLASADGKGSQRQLVATADGVLARGDGDAPELRLGMRDDKLVGSLEVQHPAHGRLEFNATRK